MNPLLQHYRVDVEFPQVSGAEHLEMLQIRDRLAELEPTLSTAERTALVEADRRLARQAAAFYAELSRFINLAEHRYQNHIPPSHWWWYLDVLSELPPMDPGSVSSVAGAEVAS
jgi:hypothetical protein